MKLTKPTQSELLSEWTVLHAAIDAKAKVSPEWSAALCDLADFLVANSDGFLRLARLGLWAEEHGVPALKEYEELSCEMGCNGIKAMEAIEALPPEAP